MVMVIWKFVYQNTPVGNSYLPIFYFFKLSPWKLTVTDTDP